MGVLTFNTNRTTNENISVSNSLVNCCNFVTISLVVYRWLWELALARAGFGTSFSLGLLTKVCWWTTAFMLLLQWLFKTVICVSNLLATINAKCFSFFVGTIEISCSVGTSIISVSKSSRKSSSGDLVFLQGVNVEEDERWSQQSQTCHWKSPLASDGSRPAQQCISTLINLSTSSCHFKEFISKLTDVYIVTVLFTVMFLCFDIWKVCRLFVLKHACDQKYGENLNWNHLINWKKKIEK